MSSLRRMRTLLVGIAALFVVQACGDSSTRQQSSTPHADLVLINGQVVTVDVELGTQQAVAVSGHKVSAVGTTREIRDWIGDQTQVIDLNGRTVIPGLIEGHGHFLSLGRAQQILDLSTAQGYQAILNQVAAAVDAAEPGEWIFGRGWHQDKWQDSPSPQVEGVPTHQSLSVLSPDNPVLLGHASGHAAFVNAAALRAAGLDEHTEDPPGGTLVRDESGALTGLLRETAQRMVEQAVALEQAKLSEEARRGILMEQVALAGAVALQHGVTSFQDAGASLQELAFLKQVADTDGLPIRLYVMAKDDNETLAASLADYYLPYTDNTFLTVRSIKKQIDGALGAHGAWLIEPYIDLPDTAGLVLEPVAEVEATARLAVALGFQVNTHAIGTMANREVLNIYERIWQEQSLTGAELRWRIEHAQHIHPDDIPRFGALGVIASVQGVHCTSDGPWIPSRLGEVRTEATSYRWRDLLDTGAVINNGTDVPVEAIDPFASLIASFTRVMNNGETFYPEQAMTREEALYSYTMANAYAAFEEDHKGSITPGKLADLVVIDHNPLTAAITEIEATQVHYTIVGGEIRYRL